MKSSGIIILCLFFILNSCIITLNDINYRYLNDKEKKHFVAYKPNNFDAKIDNSKDIFIEELTAENVRNMLKVHKFTCIELWSPYCKSEVCRSLNYYDDICADYKKNDFKLITISRTYDFDYISKTIINSKYDKQMYVIKYNERYGNNIDKVHDRFVRDFTKKDFKLRMSYYYFKDTTFIHADEFLNNQIMDSLISKYQD